MRQEHVEDLAASIVEFCRFLRTNGFSGDLRQALAALEAATHIDIAGKQSFACALQAALCCNKEEWEKFPQLFGQFWGEMHPRPRSAAGEYQGPAQNSTPDRSDA